MPVLSVSRYSTLPSSSGMVLLRTTVPGIARSRWIIQEYTTLPMSRLTRRLKESNNYCIGCRSTCTCSSLLCSVYVQVQSTECITHAAFFKLSYIQRVARLPSALIVQLLKRTEPIQYYVTVLVLCARIPDWYDV